MSQSFPICDNLHPSSSPNIFKADEPDSYDKLIDFMKEMIGADCRALIVNDEEIFNSYQSKTMTQKLTENGYRNQIITNPHSELLVEINRDRKNSKINIYMFPFDIAYRHELIYNCIDRTYTHRIFYSEGYLSRSDASDKYLSQFPNEFEEDTSQDDHEKNRNLTEMQVGFIKSKVICQGRTLMITPKNEVHYDLLREGIKKYYPKIDGTFNPKEGIITLNNISKRSYIYCGAVEKSFVKWMEDYNLKEMLKTF